MGKYINLTGQIFGRITVISFSHFKGKGISYFNCICDCGETRVMRGTSLRAGQSKSCGCLHSEIISDMLLKKPCKRELRGIPEYKSWTRMISRCYNIKNNRTGNYMKRGISVCDRWLESFENFFEDIGKMPSPKHSLDRIDNNGNYERNNCRWATIKEQCNNRTTNVFFLFNGVLRTIAQISDETGLSYKIVRYRLVNQRINPNCLIYEKNA